MTMLNDLRYIDKPEALSAVCAELSEEPWLAVDTEFQREKTYYPILCLIQIATDKTVLCIDPLALKRLDPLLELLSKPNITKVFHAGRQDLEIFYQLSGQALAPVFDTQIAAPLLGFPEQIGYAGLVERLLGITLPKAYTRADWTQRPLPVEQLRYAADDVRHLATIYTRIRTDLETRRRYDWLRDDFALLSSDDLYHVDPERAWSRIGGADRLEGPRLAILQQIAAWRELTARNENVPRSWVLKDENLVDISALRPTTREDLQRIRGIAEKSLRKYGEGVLKIVQQSRHIEPRPRSLSKRTARLTTAQEALVDCLYAIVRLRAQAEDLNPSVIGSRKDLERLVAGEVDLPLCHGWRAGFVKREMDAFLRGELSLQLGQDGVPVLAALTRQQK